MSTESLLLHFVVQAPVLFLLYGLMMTLKIPTGIYMYINTLFLCCKVQHVTSVKISLWNSWRFTIRAACWVLTWSVWYICSLTSVVFHPWLYIRTEWGTDISVFLTQPSSSHSDSSSWTLNFPLSMSVLLSSHPSSHGPDPTAHLFHHFPPKIYNKTTPPVQLHTHHFLLSWKDLAEVGFTVRNPKQAFSTDC